MRVALLILLNSLLLLSRASAQVTLLHDDIYEFTLEACMHRDASAHVLLAQGRKHGAAWDKLFAGQFPSARFNRMISAATRAAFNDAVLRLRFSEMSADLFTILDSPGFNDALKDCYQDSVEAQNIFKRLVERRDSAAKTLAGGALVATAAAGGVMASKVLSLIARAAPRVAHGIAFVIVPAGVVIPVVRSRTEWNRFVKGCSELSTGPDQNCILKSASALTQSQQGSVEPSASTLAVVLQVYRLQISEIEKELARLNALPTLTPEQLHARTLFASQLDQLRAALFRAENSRY